MDSTSSAEGLAALAICESILLSLTDNKIIEEREMEAILRDAATAHRQSARLVSMPQAHEAAAILIEGILTGGNSVRRGMGSEGLSDGARSFGDGASDGRSVDGTRDGAAADGASDGAVLDGASGRPSGDGSLG